MHGRAPETSPLTQLWLTGTEILREARLRADGRRPLMQRLEDELTAIMPLVDPQVRNAALFALRKSPAFDRFIADACSGRNPLVAVLPRENGDLVFAERPTGPCFVMTAAIGGTSLLVYDGALDLLDPDAEPSEEKFFVFPVDGLDWIRREVGLDARPGQVPAAPLQPAAALEI